MILTIHLDISRRVILAPGAKQECEKERRDFDREFVRELIVAANYLNMKEFVDMLRQGIADRIENKSVEYVRAFFGIESSFTAEEEARIREENMWVFEDMKEDWVMASISYLVDFVG